MKRKFRLSRSNDIQRVRRAGKSYAHPLLVLIAAPAQSSQTQIAIITGHRLGIAVKRNRIKRQIRSCCDKVLPALQEGWYLVILARQPVVRANFADIDHALNSLVKRAGLTAGQKIDYGRIT